MISDHPADTHDSQLASREPPRAGERLIAVFGVGVVLFCPMILRLFDRGVSTTVFGVPLLYFYIFGAWALVIALLAWAVARDEPAEPSPPPPSGDSGS